MKYVGTDTMYHRYTSTTPTAIPRKGREHIAVLCGGSCLFCCPCSAPATETISQENQTWTIGDKRPISPAPADRGASDTYRTHTRTPRTPLKHCCAQWRFCCFWSPSNRKQIYCRYTLACERSFDAAATEHGATDRLPPKPGNRRR